MKLREWSQDETERALDEINRKISRVKLGGNSPIQTSAPRNPAAGAMWLDVAGGKLMLWTGDKWESFSKD